MLTTTRPNPTPASGCATSSRKDLSRAGMSMSDRSKTCAPKTSKAIRKPTSSPVSAAGPTRSGSPDGPTTDLFGQEVAPANRSVRPVSKKARKTSAICGPTFDASSKPAGPPSSSESKSPALESSARQTRTCRKCRIEKPSSEFYANSKGKLRTACKECDRAAERGRKRRNPHTSAKFKAWRDANRGRALVNVAKHRAKKRGLPFTLEAVDIQARIDAGHCEMTGIPFDLSTPRAWNSPSLDQIEPDQGYTETNTRVVLYALNVMANTWGAQRIVEIADAITAKRLERSNALSRRIAENLKRDLDGRGSPLFALTWKEHTTPSGHVISRLRARGHRTSDKGCGSWVSPTARDHQRGVKPPRPHDTGIPLSQQVGQLSSWPTPMAGTPAQKGYNEAGNTDASRKVVALSSWPTPCQQDGPKGGPGQGTDRLPAAAHLSSWATPRVGNNGGHGSPKRASDGKVRLEDQAHGATASGSPAQTESKGQLSPAFSMWLMGYPPEWLHCAPLGKRR